LRTRQFLLKLDGQLEWTDGYRTRFELMYVDFKTQKRTEAERIAEDPIRGLASSAYAGC